MNENLELKIASLPDSPGCYLMKNNGEIIYVGKAKNLKNRVRQYFHFSKDHSPKVRAMVEHVDDFDIMLVSNEFEAFILEMNLIKLHRPHYNILLKDDKQYPYIELDMRDEFPSPKLARKASDKQKKYFGPYKGAAQVREILDTVRTIFPIRVCVGDLKCSEKRRPCLHHETGACPAPCAMRIDSITYKNNLSSLTEFLNGRYDKVLGELKTQMLEASKALNFERAALMRDRIKAVEEIKDRQLALNLKSDERDIIAINPYDNDYRVKVLFVRSGRMIGQDSFTLENAADEDIKEAAAQFLIQYYSDAGNPPHEIIMRHEPNEKETIEEIFSDVVKRRVTITIPQRGEKNRLLLMAEKNLNDELLKLNKRRESSINKTNGALRELSNALGLDFVPRRIEGYDISNTQGNQSVASMVVSIDGKKAPKEYRKFKIKTVIGPNDFESMHEVITRRLTHGLTEIKEREEAGLPLIGGKFSDLPDVILIDGGPIQLKYARDAMHSLGLNIPMFGLAKNIDEIYLPNQDETLLLDRHSEALFLIERLRDESHRFAITFHRNLRSKNQIKSRLDSVLGIGEKRKQAIIKHFNTLEEMENATPKELEEIPGIGKEFAARIYEALSNNAK